MSYPSSPAGRRPGLVLVLLALSACHAAVAPATSPSPGIQPMADPVASTDPNGNLGHTGLAELQQALTKVGDRVLFDTDRFDLTPADQSILRQQAALLNQHREVVVTISGHADERGTREYNLALGERRAAATSNYLVALGVDHSRLTVISYGKEHPVCNDATEACWSQSRRAVTELTAP
ncbi:MAG TPA: peptidoglycan-associated lipoprotein Pal [Dongiaceae bacterium]